MCKVYSYSILQTIKDILLLGHRQAFAWIDDWIGKYYLILFCSKCSIIFVFFKRLCLDMSMDDVRNYEKEIHRKTNEIVGVNEGAETGGATSNVSPLTPTNTPTGNTPEGEKNDDEVD